MFWASFKWCPQNRWILPRSLLAGMRMQSFAQSLSFLPIIYLNTLNHGPEAFINPFWTSLAQSFIDKFLISPWCHLGKVIFLFPQSSQHEEQRLARLAHIQETATAIRMAADVLFSNIFYALHFAWSNACSRWNCLELPGWTKEMTLTAVGVSCRRGTYFFWHGCFKFIWCVVPNCGNVQINHPSTQWVPSWLEVLPLIAVKNCWLLFSMSSRASNSSCILGWSSHPVERK